MRDLRALPKAHVHLHLEGSMRPRPSTSSPGPRASRCHPIRGYGTFAAFAGMYLAAGSVLTTPDAMRRLVREVVEDAANDGAVWVEPAFYAPYHRDRLGPPDAVMELVLDAAAGRGAGLRHRGRDHRSRRTGPSTPPTRSSRPELGARHAGAGRRRLRARQRRDRLATRAVRVGLRDRARRGAARASPMRASSRARRPSPARSTRSAPTESSTASGRSRTPQLVQRLADSPVCLDVCPTSNLMLAVCRSIEQHPLPALLDAGVACSVNADDSLLFGPGLLDEYELVRSGLGLDDAALAGIAPHVDRRVRGSRGPEGAGPRRDRRPGVARSGRIRFAGGSR